MSRRMEDQIHLALGIAGNVTSVLLYSAPILTFKRIIQKRSTEEFSGVPYIVFLLSALLYFWYGLPVVSYKWENITVVTICGAGVIFESAYVLIYIWFASANRKRILAILMVVAVIMVVSITTLVSTFALHDHHHRKLFVGSIGIVFTVGMYASPLVVVKRVIQTKSVEFMPFYLSLFSFLNTLLWGLYGLLAHDPFIGLPSVLGCPLSFLQLMLYYIYRNREIREKNDTDLENNGRKNEFQLP
ncbi:bidirectional sugar transporter SWEET3b-like isoform X1 [Macadamia integrifolia]|uniref:bidirectional sugar transporter SWEET3b-like isoform X1 n=1 Tax=Macadamia integrifolia TaxID=60698 RepID=UPI001C52DCF2|nr:bidirectional sugar transporter SWEET3b-like isoform X1 [Macadamia integrifolia]XP_042477346.1 bidirectional sugar transporter SWEET3b-like isoform X1 [Macadamia integrifolia]